MVLVHRLVGSALLLSLATGNLVAQVSASQSGESVMRRAASTFAALNTFEADFRQQIEDDFVDHDEARGTLYQQGDKLFAMHFDRPKGTSIVMDGTQIWVYQPEDIPGQVQLHPMPTDPTYGYNVLGWLLDKPSEKYRAVWLREEIVNRRPVDVIRLEPITANPPFRSAIIWIDQEDLLPRKLEVDERLQRRIVTLSSLKSNRPISAEQFRFIPPAGVRVLRQN